MQMLKIRFLLSRLLFSAGLFFILSCSSPVDPTRFKPENWGNKKKSFDLNLADLESRDRYDVNDIFDSIHYIPLQTTRECMFSKIDQLEVTAKLFFIKDLASKSLLVFEKDGKFKFKITGKTVSDFTIDESRGHIVLQDKMLHKVYTYDFQGRLINTKTPPFNYTGLVYINSDRIAYYRYFGSDNDIKFAPSNILIADSNDVIKRTFLPYDSAGIVYTEVRNSAKPFYKSNQDIYFAQPLDYKVFYNLKTNTLPDYFTINFPEKYRLPNDFIVNNKYLKKRLQYFKDNPYQVFLIENIYIVGSLMSFEAISEKWHDIFVYDLNNKKAISIFNFLSGPKNNCLPPGLHFLAADDKSFYRSVSARQLFNIKQAHQSQLNFATLPKVMQTYYQTQNNLSNPVIIQLIPKKKLSALKKKG